MAPATRNLANQLAIIAAKLDAILASLREDIEEIKVQVHIEGRSTAKQPPSELLIMPPTSPKSLDPPPGLPTTPPSPPKLPTPPSLPPKLPGLPPPKQPSSITETTDTTTTTIETTHFDYINNHLDTQKDILASRPSTLAEESLFSIFPPKIKKLGWELCRYIYKHHKDDILECFENKGMYQREKESKEPHRKMMYVDLNHKDSLLQHEKGHMDVSSSSKAMNIGKHKRMDNGKEFHHVGKEFHHVRNKDVKADLNDRDLAGQFPSSRLEDKSIFRAGSIDKNLLVYIDMGTSVG